MSNGFIQKILFAATLFALFIPLGAGREARAQSQTAVTVTAKAGLRGFCKSDKWLPVHVTVENKGADVNARVQASYKNGANGQTAVGMDVSLPATSRKEFFLYMTPEAFMRSFTVSVLDGDKTLAKTNLNISCGDRSGDMSMLFGILADAPSNYIALNNVQPMMGDVQTVQLEIADLPDLAQGWGMLDALIISNVDTGSMTAEQKQALKLWLASGGKLFVTGGIQWQPTAAGLGDLLPLQPSSTKKVGLTALSAYAMEPDSLTESETTVATGKLQANANVLVEQDGTPLLVEKEIGFGKVYYFAADPTLSPLNDWDGMEKIYEHLLAFKSPKPSWAGGTWDIYNANTALSTLPELSLPSFVYICCWLGLYIVIIAPANYFVLRRMKRTELAWITVPALVVIFTCMAYFSGYAYRGTKPILNRIMLSQGWQGVDKAQATALVGVYSPTRTTYNLESQEQTLLYPFPTINESLQGSNNWLSAKTDSGTVVPDVRVEIGGMQSLGMDGYLSTTLSIQHNLKYVLSDKTPVLKGSLTNASEYELKDAVIIAPGGWEVLGNIGPGESKKINLILSNTNSASISRYALTSAIGWDVLPNDKIEERRRSAFFNAVTTSYNDALGVNSGVYLMAWTDNDISVPVTLRDEKPNVTDTLFHIEKLTPEVELESAKLKLTSSVYGWESSLGDTVLTSSYNLPSNGYNIDFRPTLRVPIHISKVSSLTFTIGTNNAPQQIHPSIWNFQTETWTPLTLGSFGSVTVPEPSQHLGMDGEILLNIQGDPNNYFDIISVDFVLMVQP
ncbi:hypothetical protein ANAEL_04451 [Anaerolineales bacterium]|nr:hypothetical protein ANAEL_04451 [Anaerolineales bacterium]